MPVNHPEHHPHGGCQFIHLAVTVGTDSKKAVRSEKLLLMDTAETLLSQAEATGGKVPAPSRKTMLFLIVVAFLLHSRERRRPAQSRCDVVS